MSVGSAQLTPSELFQIQMYLEDIWLPGEFEYRYIRNKILSAIDRAFIKAVSNRSR